jgi:hypothetical protein
VDGLVLGSELSGGALGAGIGSFFPGAGTAIGGFVGGLFGGIGGAIGGMKGGEMIEDKIVEQKNE